jgi:hypothetical protein
MTMKFAGALLCLLLAPVVARAGGEIYGTIRTDRGETFTGPIRWDRNENFWDDVIDAEKPDKVFVEGGSRVRVFGITLTDDDGYWTHSELALPFGEIRSMQVRRHDKVDVVLKNGEKLRLDADGSDLGSGMRGIVIYDRDEGEIELDWGDVDQIEFAQGPGSGLDDQRLYGTVETAAGDFTGYVVWDRDESLKEDILDGDEDGRSRKVPFERIRAIEARQDASRVTLTDGDTMILEGTNDVDDSNRGIDVTVPGLGVVKVDWDEFRSVTFAPAPPSRTYDDFDGGKPLYGTVTDADGNQYTGTVVWDNDEAYSWEPLNGRDHDVEFAIRFENIRSIVRESRRSAQVTLKNGDVFFLEDSNDVDSDNKGIRIVTGDHEVELDWYEFDSVVFADRP